jgi:hypothetical protein
VLFPSLITPAIHHAKFHHLTHRRASRSAFTRTSVAYLIAGLITQLKRRCVRPGVRSSGCLKT